MKTSVRIFHGFVVMCAVLILAVSPNTREMAEPGDSGFPMVMGALVFFSVMLLHWLFERHATAIDLFDDAARARLLPAAENGYQRSFFRGTVGVGYILAFNYALNVAGFRFTREPISSTGSLFVGLIFILLGVAARARGIIVALLEKCGDPPAAEPLAQPGRVYAPSARSNSSSASDV